MNEYDVKQELIFLIRNNDLLTVAQRGVTTTNLNVTFSSTTEHSISSSTVKNIRSITVDGTPLVYGEDYLYDTDYGTKPNTTCKISFMSSFSGDAVITYDSGPDRIFGDWPRVDVINEDNYPRIAIVGLPTDTVPEGSAAGTVVMRSTLTFQVAVFSSSLKFIDQTLDMIKSLVMNNQKSLHFSNLITPGDRGPTTPASNTNSKILSRSIEVSSQFHLERPDS